MAVLVVPVSRKLPLIDAGEVDSTPGAEEGDEASPLLYGVDPRLTPRHHVQPSSPVKRRPSPVSATTKARRRRGPRWVEAE
jgi:hypothetical protein